MARRVNPLFQNSFGKITTLLVLFALHYDGIEGHRVWNDERAQAACVGLSSTSIAWIYAVRKECGGPQTCNEICESPALREQDPELVNENYRWVSKESKTYCYFFINVTVTASFSINVFRGHCDNAISVDDINPNVTGLYKLGPKVYHYNNYCSSGRGYCGPNYCCCYFFKE